MIFKNYLQEYVILNFFPFQKKQNFSQLWNQKNYLGKVIL
jgi:hypothetical protein